MINTGDNLLCTCGNDCYVKGVVYIVGDYINESFFAVMTGDSDECWYATTDCEGIYIRFNSTISSAVNNACFEHHTCVVTIPK